MTSYEFPVPRLCKTLAATIWNIMLTIKRLILLSFLLVENFYSICQCPVNDSLLTYCVDLKKQTIKLYWKDEKGQSLKNFENLKVWLNKRNQRLLFAMNAGMYKTDNSPLGLFIDSGKTISSLNTASASGNFYLKPNGVFYITKNNQAVVCVTEKLIATSNIKYATQSGPMLVIDGKMHAEFKQGSANVNIRNGVGILPNGVALFVMSKKPINLYDFATFFLKSGCKNALYLDGFVSRAYLPSQNWQQLDGNFGVMIAEIKTD